ncbi:hypothetical protein C1I98_12170 [Spongiactinospora gelatinilytica]|uniref:Uncharacterized protein n=1 Tax=Spongiactinospora gelatinilytica TaxID=2666298 RepID=A0A2W2HSD9_9ACTN|nr:hypothetical protein [Spongiactinospora gelatinilytica]PZG48857.1 hypothetical protein C1I98_12170 [Spongiactinospora gelatinilytica]
MTAAILVAPTLGLAFAHAMEWPVKMRYDAEAYTAVNRSLYRYYAVVGGPLEVAAVLATGTPGSRVASAVPAPAPAVTTSEAMRARRDRAGLPRPSGEVSGRSGVGLSM